MSLSPLTIIGIIFLIASSTITMFCTIMLARIIRTTQQESRIAATTNTIDTVHLATHLQTLAITSVEIDAEVAALKRDIVRAAQKHHLTINKKATQTDLPIETLQTRETVIKLVNKRQQDVTARVG